MSSDLDEQHIGLYLSIHFSENWWYKSVWPKRWNKQGRHSVVRLLLSSGSKVFVNGETAKFEINWTCEISVFNVTDQP